MALRFVAAFLLAHGIAKKMLKSATDVVICSQKKFRQPPHNIVVKLMYMDWHVVRRDDNTGVLVYSTDFTNTYYHPSPAHIRRKETVFDGRVLIDLNAYQSLDVGQREMLKEHGLEFTIMLRALISTFSCQ